MPDCPVADISTTMSLTRPRKSARLIVSASTSTPA